MSLNFLKKAKTRFAITFVLLTILAAYGYILYPTPQKEINSYLTNQLRADIETPKFAEFKKSLAMMGIHTISPELNKQQQLTPSLTLYVSSSKSDLNKENIPQYLVYFHFTEYWKDNRVKQSYMGLMQVTLKKTSPLHWQLAVTRIFPVKSADETGGVGFSFLD